MNVARLHAPGDLRIEDAPVPEAGRGEFVIRVRTCSTCGTDAKICRFGHHHISLPRVLGHEVAGEITDVGSEVEGWSLGRSGEHTSELQSPYDLVCRLLLEKTN